MGDIKRRLEKLEGKGADRFKGAITEADRINVGRALIKSIEQNDESLLDCFYLDLGPAKVNAIAKNLLEAAEGSRGMPCQT